MTLIGTVMMLVVVVVVIVMRRGIDRRCCGAGVSCGPHGAGVTPRLFARRTKHLRGIAILQEIFSGFPVSDILGGSIRSALLNTGRWSRVAFGIRAAIPLRFGSKERFQLAGIFDIPAHQHGVIFVLGIVAVLHERTAEFTEANCEGYFAATVVHSTDPVHVLSTPFLPIRRRLIVPSQNSSLFEVNMDIMTPSAAAVLDVPDLKIPQFWRS